MFGNRNLGDAPISFSIAPSTSFLSRMRFKINSQFQKEPCVTSVGRLARLDFKGILAVLGCPKLNPPFCLFLTLFCEVRELQVPRNLVGYLHQKEMASVVGRSTKK